MSNLSNYYTIGLKKHALGHVLEVLKTVELLKIVSYNIVIFHVIK